MNNDNEELPPVEIQSPQILPKSENRCARSNLRRKGKKPRSRKGFKGFKKNTSEAIDLKLLVQQSMPTSTSFAEGPTTPSSSSATEGTATPSAAAAAAGIAEGTTTQTLSSVNSLNVSTKLKFRTIINKSSEKLKASSLFNKKYIGKTRAQTLRYGIRKLHGRQLISRRSYKLINSNELIKSLSSAAICSKCKNKQSKLQLYEISNKRAGLCESLQWVCSLCKHSTEFKTSTSSTPLSAYDVNIRSVYASQTLGRAGLVKFCNIMDLPPPVNSSPYNMIQSKLSETASQNATEVMKRAGIRLLNQVLSQNPDSIDFNDW